MNKVILEGYLGKNPDTKLTASGLQITNTTLGTSNDFLDKVTKEWIKKPATWHSLTAFGEVGKTLATFKKGENIHAEGKLQYDSWEDSEGKKRVSTKIICFGIEKKQ